VLTQANFGRRDARVICGCRVGASLLPGQYKALARRVPLGLAPTGTDRHHRQPRLG